MYMSAVPDPQDKMNVRNILSECIYLLTYICY